MDPLNLLGSVLSFFSITSFPGLVVYSLILYHREKKNRILLLSMKDQDIEQYNRTRNQRYYKKLIKNLQIGFALVLFGSLTIFINFTRTINYEISSDSPMVITHHYGLLSTKLQYNGPNPRINQISYILIKANEETSVTTISIILIMIGLSFLIYYFIERKTFKEMNLI